MTDCIFVSDRPGHFTCSACGFSCDWSESESGSEKPYPRNCGVQKEPVARGQCVHFGYVLRTEECPTCNGSVKLKVFACALLGECTPETTLEGIACCSTCDKWEPATATSTA